MPPEPPPKTTSTTGPPSWMAPVMPVVPDHELIRRIGGGSYGDVWLARTTVGTWRAVKVVFRDRFTDARPYEREFNGIQKFEPLSRSNEGFIDILQIGRNDAAGYFYYVMELADDANAELGTRNVELPLTRPSDTLSPIGGEGRGEGAAPLEFLTPHSALLDPHSYIPKTLSKVLLQRGRLPLAECLELGLTLNLGLAQLHRAGLIHRDIKPSNIIFVGGVPKLADIGLVIELAEARSFVGTEGFIPPEGPNSPQADLYSLGKVLYEAGMGKDRKDFPEPYTQIAEAPDAAALLEFNAILLKACAANRDERYQSAEEMNADLALLQSGGSVRRQRKLAGQLRFVQRAGALVTALAAVIALGWWWQAKQAHQKTVLAAEARRNELAARQNLYAADINLAQQALLADNLRQARVLLQNHIPQPGQPDLRGFEWRHLWQQSQGDELFSLPGHTNGGRCLAFSPDGEQLASGGFDGAVKLWDAASRRKIATLEGTNEIKALAFSPLVGLLAVATSKSTRLWDTRSFALVHELPGAINRTAFSRDGKYLLTSSLTGFILWDTEAWRIVRSHDVPESARAGGEESGFPAAFSADGKHMAVIFKNSIHLFTVPELKETGVLPARLTSGPASFQFIAFSPDNKTLAAVSETGFGVQLWDLQSNQQLRVLTGSSHHVFAGGFSPDGNRFATAGADQTIRLWNVATGELIRSFKGQADAVHDLVFSRDGKRLVSVGVNDGAVKFWEADAKQRPEFFRDPPGPIGFNGQGRMVALDSSSRLVALDPATMEVANRSPLEFTRGEAYSPWLGNLAVDGHTIAIARSSGDRGVRLFDLSHGRLICNLPSSRPWVSMAPKRRLIVTETPNQTATVWQWPEGTVKWVFTNKVSAFPVVIFSPDENFLLTDEQTCMKLWRINGEALQLEHVFNPKRFAVSGTAFSPDGRMAASGQEGGVIKLWAVPSCENVGVLTGHTRDVIAVAFSPDGRTLASMCDDRTVRLWHVATRRELLRFEAPKEDQHIFALLFSPDGRALAARRFDEDGPITWLWYAPRLADIDSNRTAN